MSYKQFDKVFSLAMQYAELINQKIDDDNYIVLLGDKIITEKIVQTEGGLQQTLDDHTFEEIITDDPDTFDYPSVTEIKNYFKRYSFIHKRYLMKFKIKKE